jgi:hypothetical protein
MAFSKPIPALVPRGPQELLDGVARHLFTQGKRSTVLDGNKLVTAYRGTGGCKCGIGVIIPDREYRPTMEFQWVTRLVEIVPALRRLIYLSGLMLDLQYTHDWPEHWAGTAAMRSRLTDVARTHNLSDAVPLSLAFAWDRR